MRAFITIAALAAVLAGIVWVYKRIEKSQEDENDDQSHNPFIN